MACNGKPGTEFGQKNYMIDSIKMRSYRLRGVIATTFPSSTARVMSLNTTSNAELLIPLNEGGDRQAVSLAGDGCYRHE